MSEFSNRVSMLVTAFGTVAAATYATVGAVALAGDHPSAAQAVGCGLLGSSAAAGICAYGASLVARLLP